MKTMPLQDLKDLFSDAMQGDLEQGVAWLNDAASERFTKAHPRLLNALDTLSNLDAVTSSVEGGSRGWIATGPSGRVLHFGEADGWTVDQVIGDPSEQVRAAAEREDAQENPLTKRGDALAREECGG
jgi:hypothetical protein